MHRLTASGEHYPPVEYLRYGIMSFAEQSKRAYLLGQSRKNSGNNVVSNCTGTFILHGPNPPVMVEILTQSLHMILICPVRVQTRHAIVHFVVGHLWEWSKQILWDSLVTDKDSV